MAFDNTEPVPELDAEPGLSITDLVHAKEGFKLPDGFHNQERHEQASNALLTNFEIVDSNNDGSVESSELGFAVKSVANADNRDLERSLSDVAGSYYLISMLNGDGKGISMADLRSLKRDSVPEFGAATKAKLYYNHLNKGQALIGAGMVVGGIATSKVGGAAVAGIGVFVAGDAFKDAHHKSKAEQENLISLYSGRNKSS